MKILKKFKVLFLLLTVIIVSCQTDNEELNSEFSKFKTNFPELASKINYDNVQTNSNNKTAKSENNVDGTTFPVMDDNEVIGRYLGTNDESVALYMDFTDYTNKITIYDVNNPTNKQEFEMIYNSETGNYEPVKTDVSSRGFWCSASCALGVIAIAASDGPAPLMDYLAVAYGVACLQACKES